MARLTTVEEVRSGQHLLLECISGSHAYGLNTATSDTDIKGVFVLPKTAFYGFEQIHQVSDKSCDTVFYELNRFAELLTQANPNLLEMLYSPPDCILHRDPLFERLKPEWFLTRKCRETFAGYAETQIKKARGLNKKILNPMEKEQKSIMDFCWVTKDQGTVSIRQWLEEKDFHADRCGLVNLPHMPNLYSLYYDVTGKRGYAGLMHSDESLEVCLSSIPKGEEAIAFLMFNKDAYASYCKDYHAYWRWVENRNETRYQQTLSHGKRYDAKNMMHTIRLLEMAEEIARTGSMEIRRPNRDELLAIRTGQHSYEDLVKIAEEKIKNMDELYRASDLPENCDVERVETALLDIREAVYRRNHA
ncbi:MAG: nucleotidyltransferase domain-containing protein [Verrucomicrobiota bacterium]